MGIRQELYVGSRPRVVKMSAARALRMTGLPLAQALAMLARLGAAQHAPATCRRPSISSPSGSPGAEGKEARP